MPDGRRMVDGQHVTTGHWQARGPVRVFASGDATVDADRDARVWASGHAMVHTAGPGTAATDHAGVFVYRGRAVCIDGAWAHALGGSSIELRGLGSALSQVSDQARVLAHGGTAIFVHSGFQGRIALHDRSSTPGTRPLPAYARRYRP